MSDPTATAADRLPVKHDHLGRERIDMVDPWVKRIACWCGYEADLAGITPDSARTVRREQ